MTRAGVLIPVEVVWKRVFLAVEREAILEDLIRLGDIGWRLITCLFEGAAAGSQDRLANAFGITVEGRVRKAGNAIRVDEGRRSLNESTLTEAGVGAEGTLRKFCLKATGTSQWSSGMSLVTGDTK